MQLKTVVNIPSYNHPIRYEDTVMMIGSCFSENVGQQLKSFKYNVMTNPFGVMYNPVSVKQTLEIIIQQRMFSGQELRFANGLWFSYNHHTSFSHSHQQEMLKQINHRTQQAHRHLRNAKFLFLTFGTARVYVLKETGEVVANCHKQPQSLFDHRLLSVEDIVRELGYFIQHLKDQYPGLQLIFTVSPVRHWKDGAIGNQASKATLILAIQQLIQRHDHCYYFPSYEIFMDELRDYRFYADDMLHPSSAGKAYIWERFAETFLARDERKVREKVDKLNKAYQHKPYFPNSVAYKTFAEKTLAGIQRLQKTYSFLDFEQETAFFKSLAEQ